MSGQYRTPNALCGVPQALSAMGASLGGSKVRRLVRSVAGRCPGGKAMSQRPVSIDASDPRRHGMPSRVLAHCGSITHDEGAAD